MVDREHREFREEIVADRRYPTTYEELADAAETPRSSFYRSANIVYLILGLLEITLALRFLFLLFGANRGSGFVTFIYNLSNIFVSPFYGIFGGVTYNRTFFDPSTLIAMIIYAVIGWAIVRLIAALTKQPASST